MNHITLVKKIKADGTPCRKCVDVLSRLERDGYLGAIHRVVVADERDAQSEGMQLAKKYDVDRAPFFLVRDARGMTQVYTVYFRFVKEILRRQPDERETLLELMDQHPDLDFV